MLFSLRKHSAKAVSSGFTERIAPDTIVGVMLGDKKPRDAGARFVESLEIQRTPPALQEDRTRESRK